MNKLITAIALIPVILMSLMPPIGMDFVLTDSKLWLWLVLIFGFLGIAVVLFKINPFIKCISIFCFISTFFSTAPMISQYAYMQVIGCIYFYIMLTQIKDWELAFNCLWCILALQIIIFALQFFHHDNLLNFGLDKNTCSITVGNAMQAKSFIIILSALLLQDKRFQLKKSIPYIWGSLIIGGIVYFFIHHVAWAFYVARGPVWMDTLKLSAKHPFVGFGMGSFKILFSILATGKYSTEGVWCNAHNFFIQNIFEIGTIGCALIISFILTLLQKCKGLLLIGASLVLYTLMFHFPDRQMSAVPLLLLFAAFIERKEYGF